MKNKTDGFGKKPFTQRKSFSLGVIVLNILLIAVAVLSYSRYLSVYQERLTEENLGNISNLNQSASLNATTLVKSWGIKLDDIVRYVGQNDITHDELLVFIEQTNSSDDRQFELIGSDYNGYLARRDESGGFITLSYDSSSYSVLKKALDDVSDEAFEDICFTPEFTDGYTAYKHFAVYRHLPLQNNAGETEMYTLLLATDASDVLATFNSQADFGGQSTVLLDSSGNYIVSNRDFKSDNFFEYLYVYNDLTMDEKNDLEAEFNEKGSGEVYYKDAVGRDCVFRYEQMTTNDWYCVTCVPISSFRTPVFNVNYVIYAAVSLFLTMIVDICWLQHMNTRLRYSIAREKEASEAKTDFLSRMSHDIRTPLNGIIGLTSLAMDEESSPQMREYLDNIKVSGEFLTGLVNDILDLSKVESGKVELHPEPYSEGELCKYIGAVVTPLCAGKGQELIISAPDDPTPVLLDRLRFNQVIFNLLSNASKYTPAGGRIEFICNRSELPEGRAELEFIIRDNGIGMSEEFQKHMFESFTQEHSQTAATGSGLGLAIVSSLLRIMGGQITVKSKQGEGSTFTVRLAVDVYYGHTADTPELGSAMLQGKRVLLCEDNEINVMVAQRILEKWGVTVDVAVNGKQGVETFAASKPGTYDAVLMDIMMPEMNGLDATCAIRRLDRPDAASVPIIAMTANAYDNDVKNCTDAGMNSHLGKPVEPEQLREQLSLLIKEHAK